MENNKVFYILLDINITEYLKHANSLGFYFVGHVKICDIYEGCCVPSLK